MTTIKGVKLKVAKDELQFQGVNEYLIHKSSQEKELELHIGKDKILQLEQRKHEGWQVKATDRNKGFDSWLWSK